MKPFFIVAICLVLISQKTYAQKNYSLYELRGVVNLFGDVVIETLPVKNKRTDSSSMEIKMINKVIGDNNGKSIDVLNGLAKIGYELINTVFVAQKEDRPNNRFILYYLKKENR